MCFLIYFYRIQKILIKEFSNYVLEFIRMNIIIGAAPPPANREIEVFCVCDTEIIKKWLNSKNREKLSLMNNLGIIKVRFGQIFFTRTFRNFLFDKFRVDPDWKILSPFCKIRTFLAYLDTMYVDIDDLYDSIKKCE